MRRWNRADLSVRNSAAIDSAGENREIRATAMNDSGIEKRVTPRHRVLKHGMLAFGGGGGIDCTVRNISSGGARLDIANPVGLPQSFTLFIQADQFMRRCRAVWSSEQRIGVAFD
jgi:hypothetical protein